MDITVIVLACIPLIAATVVVLDDRKTQALKRNSRQ